MAEIVSRAEGFRGQRIFILPRSALTLSRSRALLKGLHPTRAGYFPNAVGHAMVREQGIDEAILILCLQGEGWCEEGKGIRHVIPAGTALLIPPGVKHSYGSNPDSPWTISWVHFRGADLAAYLKLMSPPKNRRVSILKSSAESVAAVERLLSHYASSFVFVKLLAAATELRGGLAQLLLARSATTRKSTEGEERIDAVRRWMTQNTHRPFSLEKAAREAGFSVPHFIVLFRARTGASPAHYFLRRKIQQACHLLDTTSLPIKNIAGQVGFTDPYYFSRLFQKVMGISPREYRKMDKI